MTSRRCIRRVTSWNRTKNARMGARERKISLKYSGSAWVYDRNISAVSLASGTLTGV